MQDIVMHHTSAPTRPECIFGGSTATTTVIVCFMNALIDTGNVNDASVVTVNVSATYISNNMIFFSYCRKYPIRNSPDINFMDWNILPVLVEAASLDSDTIRG